MIIARAIRIGPIEPICPTPPPAPSAILAWHLAKYICPPAFGNLRHFLSNDPAHPTIPMIGIADEPDNFYHRVRQRYRFRQQARHSVLQDHPQFGLLLFMNIGDGANPFPDFAVFREHRYTTHDVVAIRAIITPHPELCDQHRPGCQRIQP